MIPEYRKVNGILFFITVSSEQPCHEFFFYGWISRLDKIVKERVDPDYSAPDAIQGRCLRGRLHEGLGWPPLSGGWRSFVITDNLIVRFIFLLPLLQPWRRRIYTSQAFPAAPISSTDRYISLNTIIEISRLHFFSFYELKN